MRLYACMDPTPVGTHQIDCITEVTRGVTPPGKGMAHRAFACLHEGILGAMYASGATLQQGRPKGSSCGCRCSRHCSSG